MENVIVIGAGVVGICCARHLQRAGFSVTVLDTLAPGEATSSGNAGGIAVSEVIPLAVPGQSWRVPGYLFDSMGPLSIQWSYVPQLAPWLIRFWLACNRARAEKAISANVSLTAQAQRELDTLLTESGIADIVVREDCLTVYESEANYRRDQWAWERRRSNGLQSRELSPSEIRKLEPELASIFERGVLNEGYFHVRDPLRLTKTLARTFVENGGIVNIDEAQALGLSEDGRPYVKLASGRQWPCDRIVVAAGAWSHRLTATLGDLVPLETERGYSTTLPNANTGLRRQIISAEHAFVMTPMEMGLRLAGTVELAGLRHPPNWARADVLVTKASRFLPNLNTSEGKRWMGHRPGLPDCLPVIGRSRKSARVLYAFGHGHLGLTMAAITGRVIADLAMGTDPGIDLSPFQVDRF